MFPTLDKSRRKITGNDLQKKSNSNKTVTKYGEKYPCIRRADTGMFLAQKQGIWNLFPDFRGEAQILQLAYGGLDAVLAAVDGDGLVRQADGEFQISFSEGVGDAFHAVFTHHIRYGNGRHSGILLISTWT